MWVCAIQIFGINICIQYVALYKEYCHMKINLELSCSKSIFMRYYYYYYYGSTTFCWALAAFLQFLDPIHIR
jgi:hypothetical protein